MPLLRSAAGRANRTNEVPALLGWNGGTEDTASGDDPDVEMSDMHCSADSDQRRRYTPTKSAHNPPD